MCSAKWRCDSGLSLFSILVSEFWGFFKRGCTTSVLTVDLKTQIKNSVSAFHNNNNWIKLWDVRFSKSSETETGESLIKFGGFMQGKTVWKPNVHWDALFSTCQKYYLPIYPSVHFLHLTRSILQGHQSKQSCPDLPLPIHHDIIWTVDL